MPRKRHVASSVKKFLPLILLIPLIAVVLFLILRIFVSQNSVLLLSSPVFPKGVRYVPDQIIIKYKEGQSPEQLKEAGNERAAAALTTTLKNIGMLSQEKLFTSESVLLNNYYVLTLRSGVNVPEVYRKLNSVSQIENITPNYILTTQAVPDDPYFKSGAQWDMKKINLENAWNMQKGKSSVVVAVIDTGADYNHEDLQGVIIKGENEVVKGGDVMDDNGHGTHVAGTIAAVTNNGIGISSTSWGAKVMAIKACDASGDCPTSQVLAGIEYAVNKKVNVINISIAGVGSCGNENPLRIFEKKNAYNDAIKFASDKNILVVAAAGNHNQNANNEVPGACKNVLAVGATNQEDKRWIVADSLSSNNPLGSNYGTKVQIAAPGASILSTNRANSYSVKNGTSMAAPHVSGVVALLLSFNKNTTREKLISCLQKGASPLITDKPIGLLLNASGALSACGAKSVAVVKPTPTPAPPPFSISGTVFIDKNSDGLLQGTDLFYQGAQVVLSGLESDSAISNTQGKYIFPNLSPGTYTISLNVNGKGVGEPIDVTLSKTASFVRLDLPIPPGVVPSPTPTPTSGTSSTTCVPDPACISSGKSIQVCSFKCTPN